MAARHDHPDLRRRPTYERAAGRDRRGQRHSRPRNAADVAPDVREARDLQENIRAQNRLRARETMVHAIVAQILFGWCATATGQTCGDVIQRLALLNAWPDRRAEAASRRPSRGACLTSQARRILDQGG